MSEFQRAKVRLGNTAYADLIKLAGRMEVPFHTLHKIANGVTKNPRVDTAEKITKYYRENP